MLILNSKTAKHSEHTLLSAYHHLNLLEITRNGLVYLKKMGNYRHTFYVIRKYNGKTKTETTLTLESLNFNH